MFGVEWRQEIWLPVRLGYIWGAWRPKHFHEALFYRKFRPPPEDQRAKRFGPPQLNICFFVCVWKLKAEISSVKLNLPWWRGESMQPSATCRTTHDESHGCASVWRSSGHRTAFHTLDVISGGSFLLRGYSLRLNHLSSEFGPCFCFSFFFFWPWSPGFHPPWFKSVSTPDLWPLTPAVVH